MWRRLRSKTLAPRRPAVFREQWPLLAVSALALVVGVGFAVYALFQSL
jgi:hypothetical protein